MPQVSNFSWSSLLLFSFSLVFFILLTFSYNFFSSKEMNFLPIQGFKFFFMV